MKEIGHLIGQTGVYNLPRKEVPDLWIKAEEGDELICNECRMVLVAGCSALMPDNWCSLGAGSTRDGRLHQLVICSPCMVKNRIHNWGDSQPVWEPKCDDLCEVLHFLTPCRSTFE